MELELVAVRWTSTPKERRGAWARVHVSGFDGVILVATHRQSGIREIKDVVVGGKDATRVARSLPWSRIEFFVQQLPDLPSEVETWHQDDRTHSTLEVFHDPLGVAIEKEWNRAEGWVYRHGKTTVVVNEKDEVFDFGEELPSEDGANTRTTVRPKLSRPTGVNTDEFYKAVAGAYTEVMARTRAVAPELAEEAGVPVRTVHGWVREARRRGFLPPSSRGRK